MKKVELGFIISYAFQVQIHRLGSVMYNMWYILGSISCRVKPETIELVCVASLLSTQY